MADGKINKLKFRLADTAEIPDKPFFGREAELELCKLAWGLEDNFKLIPDLRRLAFRLEGAPGVGKNAIVYELLRRLNDHCDIPFYMIQGHEELTPEDLALSLIPADAVGKQDGELTQMRFRLQASCLATAIYSGGVCFFDEINRVPVRTMSLLVSALDEREKVFSAMTSTWIGSAPKRQWPFLFCCAMNPDSTDTPHNLPEHIRQRTIPKVTVRNPSVEELTSIMAEVLNIDPSNLSKLDSTIEKIANRGESVRDIQIALEMLRRSAADPNDIGDMLDEYLNKA